MTSAMRVHPADVNDVQLDLFSPEAVEEASEWLAKNLEYQRKRIAYRSLHPDRSAASEDGAVYLCPPELRPLLPGFS